MRRFVPIRAEGALVLGLIALIAGGTAVVSQTDTPTMTTRTTVGQGTVEIKRVDQGGVKPGPVQPRVIQQPVAPVQNPGVVAAPAATSEPVAPPVVAEPVASPEPVVEPEPAPEDPGTGGGGLLPGGNPGSGTGSGSGSGTGTGPTQPGSGTGSGSGSTGGNGTPCLLVLCPSQPTAPDTDTDNAPVTSAPTVKP